MLPFLGHISASGRTLLMLWSSGILCMEVRPPHSGCVMRGTRQRFDLLALFVSIGFCCPQRHPIPFVSSPTLSSITCSSRSWAVPSFSEDKTRNQDQVSGLGLTALSRSDWTFLWLLFQNGISTYLLSVRILTLLPSFIREISA